MHRRGIAILTFAALSMPVGAEAAPRWETLAPAPTPRTEAVAATVGEEIYLIGGFVPGGATVPLVEIYDTRSDEWRTGPPLPIPVNHAYTAAVDGTLYVFGGYVGPAFGGALQPLSLPTDRAFALRDGTWQPVAPLPSPRGAGSAAAVGHRIYLVGGVDEDSLAEETLVYDTRRDEWSTLPGLPTPRQHLGVAAVGNDVYAVGGRIDLLNSNMPLVDRLDTRRDKWRAMQFIDIARGGLGAAGTSNGYVVAVGGEFQGGTYDVAEAFDPARNKWLALPPLPTARHGLGVAAVGTKVYALAGGLQAGYSYSTLNEAIDLASLRR